MTTLRQFIDTVRQKISGLDYAADAYLSYANSVTGASDTNVGDAIMSLAAGYGQGGGTGKIIHGEFIKTENGGTVKIPVDLGSSKSALAYGAAIASGIVDGGSITWDEHLTVPATQTQMGWAPYFFCTTEGFKSMVKTPVVHFSDGTANTEKYMGDTTYRMYNNNNGSSTNGGQMRINSDGTCTLSSGAYYMSRDGYAVKFAYWIVVFD